MIGPLDIVVVVLAGGEGTRIGGGKPLIRLGGETLVERAYRRALGWSRAVVVAVRSPAQLGGHDLPLITDADGIDGPLAGLAAALEWARSQNAGGVLTIPSDMPFLPGDLPDRLRAGINAQNAAIPSSGGNLHPVCGLWRPASSMAMPEYCGLGRRSLRGFADHVGCAEIIWSTTPLDPFFNINSPADLVAAKAILKV